MGTTRVQSLYNTVDNNRVYPLRIYRGVIRAESTEYSTGGGTQNRLETVGGIDLSTYPTL